MPVRSAQRSGPVRAAVYRRMSEGKDTPDWEERQFEDGVALAERMGGTVAPEDVYTDVVSASKFSKKERKDYLRLLAAIEAPDGPRIVVACMRRWESGCNSDLKLETTANRQRRITDSVDLSPPCANL